MQIWGPNLGLNKRMVLLDWEIKCCGIPQDLSNQLLIKKSSKIAHKEEYTKSNRILAESMSNLSVIPNHVL